MGGPGSGRKADLRRRERARRLRDRGKTIPQTARALDEGGHEPTIPGGGPR
jgi:hypothetical protein